MANSFLINKLKFYSVLLLLNIIMVILFTLHYNYSSKYWGFQKNIIFSISNMKYLTVSSQLFLSKYMDGDKKDFNSTINNLELVLKENTILINGGMINEKIFRNIYNDTQLIKQFNKIQKSISEILSILKNKKTIEMQSYRNIDSEFFYLLEEYKKIEVLMDSQSNKLYQYIYFLNIILYITIFLLTLVGIILVIYINNETKIKSQEALYDELTKIQNVKGYKKEILKQLSFFQRYKIPFSLIMFDIDNFKDVNDTYGHRVGDIVLQDLVETVNFNLRKNVDSLFRVGGEEFVILCSNTSLKDAINVAEKIRRDIKLNLNSIKDKVITISVGVSEAITNDNEDTIYQRTDKLLYQSKHDGKNRVSYNTK